MEGEQKAEFDPKVVAYMILGAINGYIRDVLIPKGVYNNEALNDAALRQELIRLKYEVAERWAENWRPAWFINLTTRQGHVLVTAEEYEHFQRLLREDKERVEDEEDHALRGGWLELATKTRVRLAKRTRTDMIKPGEIYLADLGQAPPRPVVVVSREELNRGEYVLAALITSAKVDVYSELAHCVHLFEGPSGVSQECVILADTVSPIPTKQLDLAKGPVATLEDWRLQDLRKAIAYVVGLDIEPA